MHHVATQFVRSFTRLLAGGTAALHRLAAVLQRLGDAGHASSDILHNPTTAEAARRLYRTRRNVDQSSGAVAPRQRRVRPVPGQPGAGDDIEVYTDESRSTVLTTLHQLRQQTDGRDGSASQLLADFVAPKETGLRDYVGPFAVTAGHGITDKIMEFKKKELSTTTARSCWSRSPTVWLRPSPNASTSAYARSSGPTCRNCRRSATRELIKESYVGILPGTWLPGVP